MIVAKPKPKQSWRPIKKGKHRKDNLYGRLGKHTFVYENSSYIQGLRPRVSLFPHFLLKGSNLEASSQSIQGDQTPPKLFGLALGSKCLFLVGTIVSLYSLSQSNMPSTTSGWLLAWFTYSHGSARTSNKHGPNSGVHSGGELGGSPQVTTAFFNDARAARVEWLEFSIPGGAYHPLQPEPGGGGEKQRHKVITCQSSASDMFRGKRHIFEPQSNVHIDFNLKSYDRVLQPKEMSCIF